MLNDGFVHEISDAFGLTDPSLLFVAKFQTLWALFQESLKRRPGAGKRKAPKRVAPEYRGFFAYLSAWREKHTLL